MEKKEMQVAEQVKTDVSFAAKLVQVASQFDATIYVEVNDKKLNAKSIMGVMSLSVLDLDRITVTANGDDARKALAAVEGFLCGA